MITFSDQSGCLGLNHGWVKAIEEIYVEQHEIGTPIMILPQTFYDHDADAVAKKILGCYLVHIENERTTLGRIVETEAYISNDPACHAFKGKTKRNSVLFGPAGYAYVYLIYGIHYCFNVVAGQKETGQAVLIRALEPLRGISIMQERRRTEERKLLCNGPGKLTQALRIDISFNGIPVFEGPLQIWSPDSLDDYRAIQRPEIVETTRIGISQAKELPLRFYLKGSNYVSRK
ncbi:MAG TPA: DNA-3-methyladenine glycosylase [Methanotrichaceae archaeon]|nr:DNA-3-methyladenine glycosylase [Methanotrichaceae archaeon]